MAFCVCSLARSSLTRRRYLNCRSRVQIYMSLKRAELTTHRDRNIGFLVARIELSTKSQDRVCGILPSVEENVVL